MSLIEQVFREFTRYTGDGLANEPLNAPLPVGDRSTPAWNPPKAQIRAALEPLETARDEAAASAALAAAYASDAVSQGNVPIFGSTLGLAALDIPVGMTALRTRGYTTAGDGGGGMFVRVGGTETGAVQDLNGDWWAPFSDNDEFTAASFGMGTSGDDTTALETAILFISEHGGRLLLPEGEFDLARDIDVTGTGKAFTISGQGMRQTIVNRANSTPAVFWNFVDCDGLTLEDFQLDCKPTSLGGGIHGIRVARGEDVTVRRVTVRDWVSTGIIYFDPDS
ncbi:MAG TPA: hypothetical protein VM118_13540, partial [Acidobacteriota bacterium]|nr:hypothetical protein [Acidobacteriota bacterium]